MVDQKNSLGRVLVVEDDQLTATMVRTNLEHEGYSVTVANDGTRAIEWIEGQAFDLMVLDYMLPGQDGLQILSHIRGRSIGTPVLMLTARGETRLKVDALGRGSR